MVDVDRDLLWRSKSFGKANQSFVYLPTKLIEETKI